MPKQSRLRRAGENLIANAWFSYPTIVLLQLKVMWGVWAARDLTSGDTSSYFATAGYWFHKGTTVIAWSPMYTIFLGSLFPFSADAHVIVSAHRLIVVLALAAIVLALMRRLLSPGTAWLIAVWWVVLPIVFDSLYEVHLFAVLPVLAALLAIAVWPGSKGRGIATGLFVASALLMRNETAIAAALFALCCAVAEVRARPHGSLRTVGRHYGVPLLVVLLITGALYARAEDKWPTLGAVLREKHTLNVCQIYAFGYQQRHPEWKASPWTDCHALMESTFGEAKLSMAEAFRANPRAMLDHVLWNARLIPSGLQVLLFNATTGGPNPDYAPVRISHWATVATLMFAVLVVWAVVRLRGKVREWYAEAIAPRAWVWAGMACVAAPAVVVMLTQRPRPSYLLAFGVSLMAVAGLALDAVAGRSLRRITGWVAIAALALVPTYAVFHGSDRPSLRAYYRFLKPFAAQMRSGTVLMTPGYSWELCAYLGVANDTCSGVFYGEVAASLSGGGQVADVLARRNVRYVLYDPGIMTDPAIRRFATSPGTYGWRVLRTGQSEGLALTAYERVRSR